MAKKELYTCASLGASPHFREDLLETGFSLGIQKRLLRTVLLSAASCNIGRSTLRKLVTVRYGLRGLDVIGLGFHSVVVTDGDQMVQKYYHRTLGYDHAQLETEAKRLQELSDKTVRFLPYLAVSQSFETKPFPLKPERLCIASRQKRVFGENVDLSTDTSEDVLQFLLDCRGLQQTNAYCPDIVGYGNLLRNTDGYLKLVDTIGLERSNPSDYAALKIADRILSLNN